MFLFIIQMLGIDLNTPYYRGEAIDKAKLDGQKKLSDDMAMAKLRLKNETDPIKRAKMYERIKNGISDFSDL